MFFTDTVMKQNSPCAVSPNPLGPTLPAPHWTPETTNSNLPSRAGWFRVATFAALALSPPVVPLSCTASFPPLEQARAIAAPAASAPTAIFVGMNVAPIFPDILLDLMGG